MNELKIMNNVNMKGKWNTYITLKWMTLILPTLDARADASIQPWFNKLT